MENKKWIDVNQTNIKIPNYELGYDNVLEGSLSVWNDIYHRLEPIGFNYDEETKVLTVPRGVDISRLERTFGIPLNITYKPDPHDKASYRLKVEPREAQKKAISFLLGEGDFSYSKKYSQLTLNLDTGDGKTYCVIASLTFIREKSIVITHIESIKKQWYDAFLKMTDLQDDFICDISGSKAIDKLMSMNKIPYKVFLVNHSTLRSYAKKNGWDGVHEFFKKIQVGVKVYDEAHLEFRNILKLDMHTNTRKTFYLTANFERSDFKEGRVFSYCFKNIASYGVETRHDKRKHIVYIAAKINSKPNVEERASVIDFHGFNRNKYCDYIIKEDAFLNAVDYLLDYFRDKEGKKLLLVSKIDACTHMADYVSKKYPDMTVGILNSTVKDIDREKALGSDIIISTPKSIGTGVDIPGLRFCIMTEPYSSKITANQTAGRLREYSPTANTFYVEIIDVGFKRVVQLYKNRLKVFKQKCLKIIDMNLIDK